MKTFIEYLDLLPRAVIWIAVICGMALLGFADYVTGFEFSFSIFYLVPVMLAAWRLGRPIAFGFSLISALIWMMANELAGQQSTALYIPIWNAATRAGFYLVVAALLAELRHQLDHERQLAQTDSLTGAFNRRAFLAALHVESQRSRRYHRLFSVIYLDIDHFKQVNDRFGHATGDELLRTVTRALRQHTREADLVGRMGGDEFGILLPETGQDAAESVAARLEQGLMKEMSRQGWPAAFSLGVVAFTDPAVSVEELLHSADQRMYAVKARKRQTT